MIEGELQTAIVYRMPQILHNIERHIAARTQQRFLSGNRMRQINDTIFTTVNQVDSRRRRGRLRQAGIASIKGDHAGGQIGLRFHTFQRHDGALRETNQGRGQCINAALLLPVANRFNKYRHDGINTRLAIFFG